jgi:hypothetical protein
VDVGYQPHFSIAGGRMLYSFQGKRKTPHREGAGSENILD